MGHKVSTKSKPIVFLTITLQLLCYFH